MFQLVQLPSDARTPATTTATSNAASLSILSNVDLLLVLDGGVLEHLDLHEDGLQLSWEEVLHERSGGRSWSWSGACLAIPVLQLIVTLKYYQSVSQSGQYS